MTEISVFPNLPVEESGEHLHTARVCIATYEILGPSQNGGIGTAYFSLATTLASANHDVTILYLSSEPSDQTAIEGWVAHFRGLGIRFVQLPHTPRTIDVPQCMLTARDAYTWLRRQEFDIIHFPELQGHGYYCVLAKHQGLDFSNTTLCVGTHSPISWLRERNNEAPHSPDEVDMDFMERQCVELADVVLSPSQYMLRWLRTRGWTLPAACYVQQTMAPHNLQEFTSLEKRSGGMRGEIELVFFGKLEERKGIGLFCDALDFLAARDLKDFSVTFLGKNARMSGSDTLSYIRSRAEHWAFSYRALENRGREAALRFLSENAGRIAIIPSLEDNLPNTVIECLAARIPFLASRVGGIPELIADSEVERVTFPPDASELADRLGRALRDGVPIARLAIDPDKNRQRWIDWHAASASRSADEETVKTNISVAPAPPLVTACLNYCGRPELLLQSLASLRRQSWTNLEVVLSDRSATGVDAQSELDGLRSNFERKGWQITRGAGFGPCAARTIAAAHARGDYLFLMDAADYANPDALAIFVNAATRTGADILTCFLALFGGAREPNAETSLGHYPYLGGAILPGAFRNCFGSSSIFIRKDALSRLGHFREDSRASCDWEFLARASLAGCRLEVVPRSLVWYRVRDSSGPNARMEYSDQVRALTPYAEVMPASLQGLPIAALTMKLHYERLYGLAYEGLIVKQMSESGQQKIASLLNAWLDYSSMRSNLPQHRFERILHITRQLVRGRYHRFAHGFGSALRDLRRRPSQHSKR
jgi:glycosyltransferase involved in cell wall biosynthesis